MASRRRAFERTQGDVTSFLEVGAEKRSVLRREGVVGGAFTFGTRQYRSQKEAAEVVERTIAEALAAGYVERPFSPPEPPPRTPRVKKLALLPTPIRQRITHLVSPDGQTFWMLTFSGVQLSTHTGAIGSSGTHTQLFESDRVALEARYEALVIEKRALGWVEAKKTRKTSRSS